jgi:S-adenosylmethionine decarboxylase proenzyme
MAGGLTPALACVYTTVASYAAFLAGRATHSFYVADLPKVVLETNDSGDMYSSQPSQIAESKKPYFPLPELISGKEAPKTKYTSMVHSAVLSATAGYATLHLFDKEADSSLDDIEEVCHKTDDGHSKCSINGFSEEDIQLAFQEMEEAEPNDEEHLPAGQHLLIDIERVNSAFLDDEVALAKAMVDVVNESKLTLLSYHCHKLLPMGVSCVGVLLESHISFHTWPEAGVITLDLFTCGSGKLIPVLPILKRLFAIPQEGAKDIITEQPRTLWTHKYRGFRNNFLTTDLMEEIQERSSYNLKEEIVSVQTPFQRIDIYDVLESDNDHDYKHYEQLQLGEDEFFTKNPDFYSANRIVFLEGVLQSERDGNAAYHESLVHPALFFHPNPKQVAIIGGGEGATLREVLKHNTVNKVKMMEIDEMMVQVSREYLPDWNDCSDLVDSAQWCGDDKRAEMNYVDAFGWFNSRFADDVEIDEEEKFDVLIMDAL